MEGYPGQPPSPLIPFFWSPGWNSIQSVQKFQSEVNGPLKGGDPGVRLIEAGKSSDGNYSNAVPPALQSRPGEWLLVPLYHIFGSEELSVFAPAVAELVPKPYLVLNPEDANRLQVKSGEEIAVDLGGSVHRLPVRISPDIPKGIAGLPAGLPPVGEVGLPAWSKLSRI